MEDESAGGGGGGGHRLRDWTKSTSPVQKEALKKIAHVAVRYDAVRDGEFVRQCFGGGAMNTDVFGRQLTKGFGLKLSDEELEEVLKVFDKNKNGLIESNEFLLSFFELGFAEKSRRHRSQLEKKAKEMEQRKQEAIQKEKESQEKASFVLIKDFNQDDLESAFAKVKQAALLYDRSHPSAVQLDAFEAQSMPPNVFKEQLKRCFNIKLTPREFSALLDYFSPSDKDNHSGGIDCVEFLVSFFRTGFAEKTKQWIRRRDRDLRKQEVRIQEEVKKKAEANKKNELKVCYEFTEEDQKTALEKLTQVAARYDRNSPGCVSLEAFDGKAMPPHVFKEQLKTTFNIKLTAAELGALTKYFDKDESGTIATTAFLIEFFKRGFARKNKILQGFRKKEAKKTEARKAEELKKKEEADQKNLLTVTNDFTKEDLDSAISKVTRAALRYDKHHPSAVSLSGFEGKCLAPHEFKDQLKLVFNIKLTPAELGALMDAFDKDKSGAVACQDFLLTFFQTGFKERNRIRQLWRTRELKREEAARQAEVKKKEEADNKYNLTINTDYAQGDFDNALHKITEAAVLYDRYHPSAVQLDAFDGAGMVPHIFKEQLRRVFNVKLNPKELGAVMAHFDKDGSGEVDCSEFLLEFFKLGFEERSRRIKLYRQREAVHEKKRLREEELKRRQELAKGYTVAKPFTEEDLDSAVVKLVNTAMKYTRRSLGFQGLAGFEVGSMTPGEFRLQLYRTFGLTLTSGELGALTAFVDHHGTGDVNVPEFLSKFFKISIVSKGLKDKPDAKKLLKEYRDKIKESIKSRKYNFEELKNKVDDESLSGGSVPETDNKPGSEMKKLPPATTPRSKLERRLMRADSSCSRLDLSTYKAGMDCDFKLSDLPSKVFDVHCLQELWLTNNRLTHIPPGLQYLTDLRTLSLTGNQLKHLPTELTSLTKLQRFYADANLLTTVPADLLEPSALALKEVKLDYNQLTTIPIVIGKMKNLEVLGLSHNQITNMPPDAVLGKLMRVEALDMEHNLLGPAFPPALFALFPNLRSLLLYGNKLTKDQEAVIWRGFIKLQQMRLVHRAVVKPRGFVDPDDYGAATLGEYLIPSEAKMSVVLHNMLKKRKLLSANYHIVRESAIHS